MKCIICNVTIKGREPRQYVNVYQRNGKRSRRLYACVTCGPTYAHGLPDSSAFDRLIDALPTKDDILLDVGHCELEALKLATDKIRLNIRLQEARAMLRGDFPRYFSSGHFDFEKRRLVGAGGLVLQWKTRARPDKPVAYLNQQTTVGYVQLENNNDTT